MFRIEVIDSHTGGEPTRVVVAGGPNLGGGTMAQRRDRFRAEFDHYRRAIVCEPRGSDVLVGALVCPPVDSRSVAGAIFFNNVGYLGMCGHGAIGLAVTLGQRQGLSAGRYKLETPVGDVSFEYDGRNAVSLENVPSYRCAAGVAVDVEGVGTVVGDIAWGGNWFFLTHDVREELTLANVVRLTDVMHRIRTALARSGIVGSDGGAIDHIELFGPPRDSNNHSRNFVLCPGGAYDRSPCGTGTSAKLACLAADGKLAAGAVWRQESITGSVFEAWYRHDGQNIVPVIKGQAYLTSEATLLVDDNDPLAWGLSSPSPGQQRR